MSFLVPELTFSASGFCSKTPSVKSPSNLLFRLKFCFHPSEILQNISLVSLSYKVPVKPFSPDSISPSQQ